MADTPSAIQAPREPLRSVGPADLDAHRVSSLVIGDLGEVVEKLLRSQGLTGLEESQVAPMMREFVEHLGLSPTIRSPLSGSCMPLMSTWQTRARSIGWSEARGVGRWAP